MTVHPSQEKINFFTFSVKKCSIDNTNSTLQPENLTPNEDLTDEIADFVLKNEKGKTCVRLSGEIDIKYQYEKSNGNLVSKYKFIAF